MIAAVTTTAVDVVRRYLAAVADADATADDLAALLHPDVRVVEHPNLVSPHGARRGRDEVLAAYEVGKRLMARQEFELQDAVERDGLVAARATWRGELAQSAGPLPAGGRLPAHIPLFVRVREGLVIEHETYDCYEPCPSRPPDRPANPGRSARRKRSTTSRSTNRRRVASNRTSMRVEPPMRRAVSTTCGRIGAA
jgi:ketosteroid isomerase-like protein